MAGHAKNVGLIAKNVSDQKLKEIKTWAGNNKKLLTALGVASIFAAGTLGEIERRLRAKAKRDDVKLTMNGRYKTVKELVRDMAKKKGITKKNVAMGAGGIAAAAGLAGAAYYRYRKNKNKSKSPKLREIPSRGIFPYPIAEYPTHDFNPEQLPSPPRPQETSSKTPPQSGRLKNAGLLEVFS